MASNLHTFNPFSGLVPGIRLKVDGVDPNNQKPRPEHIPVGEWFIAVDRKWHRPALKDGRLLEAGLRTIEPLSGGKSFQTLVGRQTESGQLVLIDLQTPAHIKRHVSPEEVNARFALECFGSVKIVMQHLYGGSALIEFFKEDGEVDIWSLDGMIYRLVMRAEKVIQISLTHSEIAKLRVEQFRTQINGLDLNMATDIKRCHGIIAGVTRLLRYTNDTKSQDILVNFLVEQIGPNLADGLRVEIRGILLRMNHKLAGSFVAMAYGDNIVPFKSVDYQAESIQQRALTSARREVSRRVRDKNCQEMKGSSSGGGGKQGHNKRGK